MDLLNISSLTDFFMWCTILNGAILVFWALMCRVFPDLVYRIQSGWIDLPRETFNVVIYSFLGFFKILFLVFNLIPFLALSLM